MPNLTLPALDPMTVAAAAGSAYPDALKAVVQGRRKRRLGPVLGLTNFGVNVTTLLPGAGSAHRHWHMAQDEFILVLEGELTLITDGGEQVLRVGECAGFPKGKADGHQLLNKGTTPAVYLEVGDRTLPDNAFYPDVDLAAEPQANGGVIFTHKDGTPY
jgi:uncharacterized cupin superfamily protein